jgi:hypothetical protein
MMAGRGVYLKRGSVRRIVLDWRRYDRLTDARRDLRTTSCVYVQADAAGRAVRIGKAGLGLHARYRGSTGWALDAAMHGSGNQVFAAAVPFAHVAAAEAALIWTYRDRLIYNNVGKRVAVREIVEIEHRGDGPRWD